MKKMTCLLISLAILVLCMPALAEATPWQYDSMNMYLMLKGEVTGDVQIPSEVDGQPVKALMYGLFSGQNSVASLSIPDSVEALGSGAISRMDALTDVHLSMNLAVIENGNFSSCPNLASVTVPASVCYIEDAFWGCENLREIRFTGACPTFSDSGWCFSNLPNDCVIYVPDDQLDAYKTAVGNENGAADKMRPSGADAVSVDYTAAEGDFTFDASTGTITAYNGDAARVDIPATIGGAQVKSVGTFAFNTYAVRYVVFPEGLETIGDCAFYQASNLCVIKFPSTLRSIGTEAFFNAQARVIEWNEGLEEIGIRAFMYDYEPTLALPSTVKTVGESAFEGARMTELYLGNQMTAIGARAFADTPLTYMAFDLYAPIEIASDAFAETNVADLDLPWDSSDENRRAYASLLTDQCPDCTVWINNPISGGVAEYPENNSDITAISNGVWTAYNGSAADLTIWPIFDDINVTGLGDGLFKGNQSIRRFYPHHCGWFTSIGAEAFADSSLEYVEMFGSITTIGREAFRDCVNITELTLPASVAEIGDGVFKGCTGLQKLTVLCDPALLPGEALAGCSSLREIYAAAQATDEQVRLLSAAANRPWYLPVARVGETMPVLQAMPYEPLPADDFWYDEEYARLDRYNGYEVNLVLPREIDGAALSMIGGDMMTRASYGDNFEMELPVRSVVIPETYRELTYFGFANCETLETVVFYAPIETLPDGFFSGCTNLRQVVFVNGVRNISRSVFANCPNLETVYLGECVENADEYAFTDEDGTAIFSLDKCILSADDMPDIDALLTAVQSEPVAIPESTEEPAAIPEPIGSEGEAFFGTWYGVSMEMEGETYNMAEFGMNMQMTLNADGTAALFDGEETDTVSWKIENGLATLDTMALTLIEDGRLRMEEDGVMMFFAREAEAFTPEPIGAEGEGFFGTWYGISMEMAGEIYNMTDMGINMKIALNADGTAEMTDGDETRGSTWHYSDGIATIGGSQLRQAEDGGLYLEEDGARINFSRTPNTAAAPSEGTNVSDPQGHQDPEKFGASEFTFNLDDRLEKKYVMDSADIQGMKMTAAMMGGYEYSLVFHVDGTVDFVMAGASVPGLRWTQGKVAADTGELDALVVDYYGTPLNVIITEEGFDMNYFNSMLIHFIAEE